MKYLIVLIMLVACDKQFQPPKYDLNTSVKVDWKETYKPSNMYICDKTGVIINRMGSNTTSIKTKWYYTVAIKCEVSSQKWDFPESVLEPVLEN